MTNKLFQILTKRFAKRDISKPWVFWHKYWSRTQRRIIEGPYQDRKKLMKRLCQKAGVRYFRFHAFRHFGASVLDVANVNLGGIQRILGHENRTTTEIYLHRIGDSDRDAMDLFEKVMNESHESERVTHQMTHSKASEKE